MKDLMRLRVRVVVRTSNMKISRRCLTESASKNCIKKRAVRAAGLFFLIQAIKSFICGVVVAVTVVRRFLNPLKYLAQSKQPTKTLRNVVMAENFSVRSYKSERVRVSHAMKASQKFSIRFK